MRAVVHLHSTSLAYMHSTSFGIVTYVTYMHSTPFRIVTYVAYMHSTSFRIVTYVAYMHSTLTNLHLAYQRGRPMPDANSSRLVLEYMLVNRPVFVKAYHNRVYSYSSGSKFSEVAYPLQQWMEQLESQRAKNPSLPSAKRTLKLLNNVNNLHRVVGDALISFVKAKPEPFLTHILKSKDHFWSIGKVYKFCMTFVFLLRYVFGYKSQHQWRKFTVRVVLCTCCTSSLSHLKPNHSQERDYKLNVRCFDVFLHKHKQVFEASQQYQALPENPSTPPRKRAHASASLSSDSPAPKVRKTYKVGVELTESESDDEE